MKINNKKRKSGIKTGFTILGIVVFAGVAVLLYAYSFKKGPFAEPAPQDTTTGSINYNPPTSEEKAVGESIKNRANQAPDTPPSVTNGAKTAVVMDITALSQESDVLYIRTIIRTLTSSGTCTLSMSGPGGKTYQATANVQAGPNSSTCQGFNVPVTQLSSGAWKLTITFENSSQKGGVDKEVVVQ